MPAQIIVNDTPVSPVAGRTGQCGRLEGLDFRWILSTVGRGKPLPPGLRAGIEASFGASFSDVLLHTSPEAGRMAEHLGTEAFAIGNHVIFGSGRFQPHSRLGWELLCHELAHTQEAMGREDHASAWFTLKLNRGPHPYLLWGQPIELNVGSDSRIVTHEEITRQAVNLAGGYPLWAQKILTHWVAEIDSYKTSSGNPLSNLADRRSSPTAQTTDFPELRRLIDDAGGSEAAEKCLHAYSGPRYPPTPSVIGMSSLETAAARLSGGVIGTLRQAAIVAFNARHHKHAIRLLGISLHTIQDFYSHKVLIPPISPPAWVHMQMLPELRRRELVATFQPDPHAQLLGDLRDVGRREGGHRNVSILEDDPRLDEQRWQNARQRTAEQLMSFTQACPALSGMSEPQ